jgi:RNA polymerase sigma-70 factor (ECF subfamily)
VVEEIKKCANLFLMGYISKYETGNIRREFSQLYKTKEETEHKISGETIRKKIENPEDSIHGEVKKMVASLVSNASGQGDVTALIEDLTQEVLLKIWRKADTFDGRSQLGTWLFKIAYNDFQDYIKKNNNGERNNRNTESLDQSEEFSGIPASDSFTESQLVAEIHSKNFLNYLKTKLNPEKYKLLQMLIEGLSGEEIAKVLQVPENTLKTKIRRLRIENNKLRKQYELDFKNAI